MFCSCLTSNISLSHTHRHVTAFAQQTRITSPPHGPQSARRYTGRCVKPSTSTLLKSTYSFIQAFRGSRLILPVPLPQPACLSHSLSKASCRCSAPACDTRPAVPPHTTQRSSMVARRRVPPPVCGGSTPVRSGGQSASVRRRRRTPSILAQPVTLGLGGSPCDRGYARTAPLPPPHRTLDDRDASVASSRHSAVLCPSRGAATQRTSPRSESYREPHSGASLPFTAVRAQTNPARS